jgi:2-polyprenyl-3-methyl-5-hydroxy-6-metoxy-1,4-benzoquinol methylase
VRTQLTAQAVDRADKRQGQRHPLPLTGERTVPGVWHENYWFRRHEAAYLAAASFCQGARVLEAGCGEGYGAALVRQEAGAEVLAVDYDEATVRHVRSAHPAVSVVRANLVALPVRAGTAEVVVALQVIEHLWDQERFVRECARALRPAGTLIVTTPNRLTFTPAGVPANPFHARELSAAELVALVAPEFSVTRLQGLRHGPRLRRWERRHGSLVEAQLKAPPEDWPPPVRRAVATVAARDFRLTERALDASLDLFLVALKRPAKQSAKQSAKPPANRR